MSHASSHWANLFKSSWSIDLLIFRWKTQSSAKRWTLEFMLSGRSLIHTKKRMGPNTEPWVTPDNTGAGSAQTPSKTTFCIRQIAKLWSTGGYHFGYHNTLASKSHRRLTYKLISSSGSQLGLSKALTKSIIMRSVCLWSLLWTPSRFSLLIFLFRTNHG